MGVFAVGEAWGVVFLGLLGGWGVFARLTGALVTPGVVGADVMAVGVVAVAVVVVAVVAVGATGVGGAVGVLRDSSWSA